MPESTSDRGVKYLDQQLGGAPIRSKLPPSSLALWVRIGNVCGQRLTDALYSGREDRVTREGLAQVLFTRSPSLGDVRVQRHRPRCCPPNSQTRRGEPPPNSASETPESIPEARVAVEEVQRGHPTTFPQGQYPGVEEGLTREAGDGKRSGGACSRLAFLSFQCHDAQTQGEKRIFCPPLVLSNHRPEKLHLVQPPTPTPAPTSLLNCG